LFDLSEQPPQVSIEEVYRHKLESMTNNSLVGFYDNFGPIFKGSEDKATNGIEN